MISSRILAGLAAGIALSAAPAFGGSAYAAGLDGRTFDGVIIEKGKTKGDADMLVFKNGRFRSSFCDQYGFGDAAYKAVAEGEAMRFETETQSPKHGTLRWTGYVRGDKLDATVIWLRSGKAPVEQWYVGGLKK